MNMESDALDGFFQQTVTFEDPPAVTSDGQQHRGMPWTVPALVDHDERISHNSDGSTVADILTVYVPVSARRPKRNGLATVPGGQTVRIHSVRPWDQLAGFPQCVEIRCGHGRN